MPPTHCISNKLFADADAAGPGTTGWELLPDLIGLELELRHVFKRSPGAHLSSQPLM